jgi:Tfp pilus assembly protein PilV
MKDKKSVLGFTLSELVLASAILAVAICGLLAAYVNSILMNESSSNLAKAANDAQYVLEQVKGLSYAGISTYVPPTFTNLTNEAITLAPAPYESSSGIKQVTVNVNWIERQRNRTFSLTTRIAKQ